jgi:hypothetical protein
MSRGQRHRQCGCFSAAWDLHNKCAKHSLPGDCLYFTPGFSDTDIRCLVCVLWTDEQWLTFRKSQTANSARRLRRISKAAASSALAVCIPVSSNVVNLCSAEMSNTDLKRNSDDNSDSWDRDVSVSPPRGNRKVLEPDVIVVTSPVNVEVVSGTAVSSTAIPVATAEVAPPDHMPLWFKLYLDDQKVLLERGSRSLHIPRSPVVSRDVRDPPAAAAGSASQLPPTSKADHQMSASEVEATSDTGSRHRRSPSSPGGPKNRRRKQP